jgi:hypothetical protein
MANLYHSLFIPEIPLRPDWGAVSHYDIELHAELTRLLEKQIELMELATFVRLTDAEVSESEKRQKRISELLEQLSTFEVAA